MRAILDFLVVAHAAVRKPAEYVEPEFDGQKVAKHTENGAFVGLVGRHGATTIVCSCKPSGAGQRPVHFHR